MITRLQVTGFKNLLGVDIHLGPFTCIAGLNGAGKSNIFDAIRLLHLLAQHPISEAVQLLRESKGRSFDPASLLTAFEDYRAPQFKISVDLLLKREVEDDFGVGAKASTSSVSYTVAFRVNEDERTERLELVEERLVPITLERARREMGFPASPGFRDSAISGRRPQPFISTFVGAGGAEIRVHQEGHGGRKVPAPKSSRTVLGGLASADFPTLLATQREMQSWKTLLLEPSAMRAPSGYRDPAIIDSRGANLAAALDRLSRQDTTPGQTLDGIANRLSQLLEDVREVKIHDDERTETYTLEVCSQDRVFHAARALSDGTLRFLVLATLAVDPQATGVICLEEPENGIHPERIGIMVELLRDIAVDPQYPPGPDNALRQVLVNTHSPVVVEEVSLDELIYIGRRKLVLDDSVGYVAVASVPPESWRARLSRSGDIIAPGHLLPYFRKISGKRPQQLNLPFGEKEADA